MTSMIERIEKEKPDNSFENDGLSRLFEGMTVLSSTWTIQNSLDW